MAAVVSPLMACTVRGPVSSPRCRCHTASKNALFGPPIGVDLIIYLLTDRFRTTRLQAEELRGLGNPTRQTKLVDNRLQ
jgi:hypothetical protein